MSDPHPRPGSVARFGGADFSRPKQWSAFDAGSGAEQRVLHLPQPRRPAWAAAAPQGEQQQQHQKPTWRRRRQVSPLWRRRRLAPSPAPGAGWSASAASSAETLIPSPPRTARPQPLSLAQVSPPPPPTAAAAGALHAERLAAVRDRSARRSHAAAGGGDPGPATPGAAPAAAAAADSPQQRSPSPQRAAIAGVAAAAAAAYGDSSREQAGFSELAEALHRVLPRIVAPALSVKWKLISQHIDRYFSADDAALLAARGGHVWARCLRSDARTRCWCHVLRGWCAERELRSCPCHDGAAPAHEDFQPSALRAAGALMLTEQCFWLCGSHHSDLRPMLRDLMRELCSAVLVAPPSGETLEKEFFSIAEGSGSGTVEDDAEKLLWRFFGKTHFAALRILARQKGDEAQTQKRNLTVQCNQMNVLEVAIRYWQRHVQGLLLRGWRREVRRRAEGAVQRECVETLEGRIQEAEEEKRALSDEIAELTQDRDSARFDLVQAQSTILALRDQAHKFQNEITARDSRIADLTRALAEEAPLQPLKEEIAECRGLIAKLQLQLQQEQESSRQLLEQEERRQREGQDLQEAAGQLQELRSQLEGSCRVLLREVVAAFFPPQEHQLRHSCVQVLSMQPGPAALVDWLNRMAAGGARKGAKPPAPVRDLSARPAAILPLYVLALRKMAPALVSRQLADAALPPAEPAVAAELVSSVLEPLGVAPAPSAADLLVASAEDHAVILQQLLSRFCNSANATLRGLQRIGESDYPADLKDAPLNTVLRAAGVPIAALEDMTGPWWSAVFQRVRQTAQRWVEFAAQTAGAVAYHHAALAKSGGAVRGGPAVAVLPPLDPAVMSSLVAGCANVKAEPEALQGQIEALEKVLAQNAAEIGGAFDKYSRLDSKGEDDGGEAMLSMDEFLLCLRDAKVFTRGGLGRKALAKIFDTAASVAAAAPVSPTAETKSPRVQKQGAAPVAAASSVPRQTTRVEALSLCDYVVAMVKVAKVVYEKGEQPLHTRVQRLISEHIAGVAHDDIKSTEFHTVIRGEETQQLIRAYRPVLQRVFRHYAALGGSAGGGPPQGEADTVMDIGEFQQLVEDLRLLDGTLTVAHVRQIFIKLQDDQDPQTMVYQEFCEAVTMLALMRIPYCYLATHHRLARFLADHLPKLSAVPDLASVLSTVQSKLPKELLAPSDA